PPGRRDHGYARQSLWHDPTRRGRRRVFQRGDGVQADPTRNDRRQLDRVNPLELWQRQRWQYALCRSNQGQERESLRHDLFWRGSRSLWLRNGVRVDAALDQRGQLDRVDPLEL